MFSLFPPNSADLVVLFHFLLGGMVFNKNKQTKKTQIKEISLLFHSYLLPAREGENLKGQNHS